MTVCIAVMCNDAKRAIAVADRMITAGDTEFEQETRKIEKLANNCVAITAGSALAHTEIFRPTINEFINRTTPEIDKIVESIKTNFVALRKKRAEEENFKPLGLTIEQFIQKQRDLDSSLVMRLTRSLEEAKIRLEILVVGVDKTGAHIYYIGDPGRSEVLDSIGYCAVGSGERHAEGTFIDYAYGSNFELRNAVYIAYEAKRRAEKAPGVGQSFTDVSLVSENEIKDLSSKEINLLKEIFEQKLISNKSILSSLNASIQDLPFK